MADVLKVEKSKAIALFVALGFQTAKKWDCKKLTAKLNSLEEIPDEPFEEEGLDELVDQLQDAESVEVFDDAEDAEPEETVEVEEDEDIEEEKPAKKSKKDKQEKTKEKKQVKKVDKEEKPAKKTKPVEAKAKVSKGDGTGIDDFTLGLIKEKSMNFETIVAKVMKKFPDKEEKTIRGTTYRRLHGHLQKKFGVTITESEKGLFSVK